MEVLVRQESQLSKAGKLLACLARANATHCSAAHEAISSNKATEALLPGKKQLQHAGPHSVLLDLAPASAAPLQSVVPLSATARVAFSTFTSPTLFVGGDGCVDCFCVWFFFCRFGLGLVPGCSVDKLGGCVLSVACCCCCSGCCWHCLI